MILHYVILPSVLFGAFEKFILQLETNKTIKFNDVVQKFVKTFLRKKISEFCRVIWKVICKFCLKFNCYD